MACPSTWGEKFQLANLPFPPLTLCINYNMRSSCTALINKACPAALLWSPWPNTVCVLQVHFQQPPIPIWHPDCWVDPWAPEYQPAKIWCLNLLSDCYYPWKATQEVWILYPSHIHTPVVAGGCSQDSNPTVLQPPTQFLRVLKLTLQVNETKKELWLQSARQSKTRVVSVRMELQVIHRNQAHMYPHPSQAVYSWSHPNFPCSNWEQQSQVHSDEEQPRQKNKQAKYANQNVSKYFLKLHIDSNSQTLYPKRANYHSLNCWLMRPEHWCLISSICQAGVHFPSPT